MSAHLPLLKLPLLVMEQVLGEMDFLDTVSLSLLSKRCTRVIRLAGRYIEPVSMGVHIEKNANYVTLQYNDDWSFVSWEFLNLTGNGRCKKTAWSIGGMDVIIKKHPVLKNKDVLCPTGKKDVQMNAVISHFLKNFRSVKLLEIIINLEGLDPKFRVERALGAACQVQRLVLHGQDYQGATQFILSNIEITQDYVNYSKLYMGGPFNEPKLKCAREIECNNSSWMSLETLLSLNCPRIHLMKTRFQREDLMEFLRKWKNSTGDDMKRITVLEAECPSGATDNLDLTEFEPKPWDPEIRPRDFEYPNFITENCSEELDIERSDGLLGTVVRSHNNYFYFRVWHEKNFIKIGDWSM